MSQENEFNYFVFYPPLKPLSLAFLDNFMSSVDEVIKNGDSKNFEQVTSDLLFSVSLSDFDAAKVKKYSKAVNKHIDGDYEKLKKMVFNRLLKKIGYKEGCDFEQDSFKNNWNENLTESAQKIFGENAFVEWCFDLEIKEAEHMNDGSGVLFIVVLVARVEVNT